MKGLLTRTDMGLIGALVFLLAMKLVLPDWLISVATISLARGLVVLGLLILWRTGLISFGQALFFGIGGYTVGLLRVYAGVTDMILLTFLATFFFGAGRLPAGFADLPLPGDFFRHALPGLFHDPIRGTGQVPDVGQFGRVQCARADHARV